MHQPKRQNGFTLVEILIVVIILGILAAIVVPQFSNATTDARKASLTSELQTIRQQIQIYKLQHHDQIPDLLTDWTPLTATSVVDGVTVGPYLPAAPKNPLISDPSSVSFVSDGDGSSVPMPAPAFIYDSTNGTGQIWAVDANNNNIFDETAGQ